MRKTTSLLKVFLIVPICLILIPINSFFFACQSSDEQMLTEITTFNDELIKDFEIYYNVKFPEGTNFLKAQDKPEGLHYNSLVLFVQVKSDNIGNLLENSTEKTNYGYIYKNTKDISEIKFSKHQGVDKTAISERKIINYFVENGHPAISFKEQVFKLIKFNFIPFVIILLIIFGDKL